MKIRHILYGVALLCLLIACSSSKSGDDDDTASADPHAKKAVPICPQVAIVRELDTVRDYGGENPAPNQLVAGAKLLNVEGDCEYQKAGIDITYDLNMAAERGPALGGKRVSFPFFIAVLDPDGAILNKDQMTAEIQFSSDSKVANHNEPLHIFIPLDKDKRKTGPDYRVLMGFQLTEEQFKQMQAQQPQ